MNDSHALAARLDAQAAPYWPLFLDDPTNAAARAALIEVYRPIVAYRARRRGLGLKGGMLCADDLAQEALARLIVLLDRAQEPCRASHLLASLSRDTTDLLRVRGPVNRTGRRQPMEIGQVLHRPDEAADWRCVTVADLVEARSIYRGDQVDPRDIREFRRDLVNQVKATSRELGLYMLLRYFRGWNRDQFVQRGMSKYRQGQLETRARAWLRKNYGVRPPAHRTIVKGVAA